MNNIRFNINFDKVSKKVTITDNESYDINDKQLEARLLEILKITDTNLVFLEANKAESIKKRESGTFQGTFLDILNAGIEKIESKIKIYVAIKKAAEYCHQAYKIHNDQVIKVRNKEGDIQEFLEFSDVELAKAYLKGYRFILKDQYEKWLTETNLMVKIS